MGRKILQLLNGLITFAVTVCLIGAGAYAGFSLWDNQQVYDSADSVFAELKDIRATIQTPTLSAMEQLLEENRQKREAEAAARAAEAAVKEVEAPPETEADASPEAAQAIQANAAEVTLEAVQTVQVAATVEAPAPATETAAQELETTQAKTAETTPEGAQAVHTANTEMTAAPATETITSADVTAVVTVAVTETISESTAEVTVETITEQHSEQRAETTSELTAEPISEATAETVTEPTLAPTAETAAEPTLAPTAETAVEPTSAPTAELTPALTAELIADPTAEPTAKPTVEPTTEPTVEPTMEPTPEPTPDNSPFGQLKQINKDITAWITMPGTAIDYPVLQGESNYSYINTDVYGNFALAGSIFLDSRNDSEYRDTYSLLYGHNMSQHRMFSDINLYKEKEFFEENKLGLMLLPDGYHILESLCVIVTRASDSGLFNPENWKVLDAEGIKQTMTENAMYLSEDGMQALDAQLAQMTDGTGEMPRIVSLSTCSDEFTDARTILLTLMDP